MIYIDIETSTYGDLSNLYAVEAPSIEITDLSDSQIREWARAKGIRVPIQTTQELLDAIENVERLTASADRAAERDSNDIEIQELREVRWAAEALIDALKNTTHRARPDDLPEPDDRCKDCGQDITWVGPSQYDWEHVS